MPVFTIADTESLSGAKSITAPIVGIETPASLEGTVLTFQACDTVDGTYANVYDAIGTEVQVTISSSRYVALLPSDFIWAKGKYLKVRTGTAGSPSVQTGANTVTVDVGDL